MERLKNLSGINTNTIEGRILVAALSKISCDSERDKEPDEILNICQDLAEKIYKDALPLPSPEHRERPSFKDALTSLINKYSMENDSNTPDYILAEYLIGCLLSYERTINARDKWFGVDMWERSEKKLSTS